MLDNDVVHYCLCQLIFQTREEPYAYGHQQWRWQHFWEKKINFAFRFLHLMRNQKKVFHFVPRTSHLTPPRIWNLDKTLHFLLHTLRLIRGERNHVSLCTSHLMFSHLISSKLHIFLLDKRKLHFRAFSCSYYLRQIEKIKINMNPKWIILEWL